MRGQTMTLSAPFASALPMAEPAESELSFTSCQLRDQCRNFTGMRPVFGDILISFGVVW